MTYASELVALLATGLFAGGAVFVSVAEHPARTEAGTAVALAEFAPSYRRAAPLQGGAALVALVAGIIAAIASGNWEWALAAGCVGAAIPLTLLVIGPVNRRLMNDAAQLTEAETTELFASWARLHAMRTLAGLAGFAVAAAVAVAS
jgi:Domain of unknown function (DUF1772)